MSLKSLFWTGTAAAMLGTAAQADVTAQDIWSDWQSYFTGFGYTVEGDETVSGGSITVSNVTMSVPLPDSDGSASIALSQIEFTQTGDGTVDVAMPSSIQMTLVMNVEDEADVQAVITATTDNFTMNAAGVPSEITYTYSADALAIDVTELVVDGDQIGGNVFKATMNMADLAGTSIMQVGALRTIAQDLSLGATNYDVSFADPSSSDTFAMNGQLATIVYNGTAKVPAQMDPSDMVSALADGFSFDGTFGYSSSSNEFTVNDESGLTGGRTGAETASILLAMDGDAMRYDVKNTGVTFELAGSAIPLPINAQLGEIGFNLVLPISKDSSDPSDFALGVTLGDFVTTDMIWSLLDPGNVLPRDPATISFDLAGKAKMLVDFLDPIQMAAVEDGDVLPAELNALTLNNLLVSAAGATLTGDGDFTFDNTDLESFDGLPKPTGALNLALTGGNGLMDKLVQMGLLPQEQAMGARMMMGLFARPGEGEDSLTSTVEINEQGHILANGQRIQ